MNTQITLTETQIIAVDNALQLEIDRLVSGQPSRSKALKSSADRIVVALVASRNAFKNARRCSK